MSFTTVKSIEKALNLVESKKENLHKAFQELQSHSSLLSSFNFTWLDLDTHFTSIQSELLDKLSTLQSLESSQTLKPKPEKRKDSSVFEPVPARAELKSLCENMDAMGLRKYVIDRPKERAAIRAELGDALKHARDPGLIVLDVLEGFWEGKMGSESRFRTSCVMMMEELMRFGAEIGPEVRERAMGVAVEWKEKMGSLGSVNGGDGDDEGKEGKDGKEDEGSLERLGYLQLLASYKLLDVVAYDVNELIDYVVVVARYRQAVELCQVLGLESRISDVIQKLIGKRKQLMALKFILEFELTDEFPPVPLLKAYVTDSKKRAQKVRKTGKNSRQSLNEAAAKEISALRSVIRCIEDHDLESQFPKDELVNRIEKLEKEKADRKRPVPAPVPKPKQHVNQQIQNGNKRLRAAAPPMDFRRKLAANSGGPSLQPSSLNRAGLLPDHHVGAYGISRSLVPATAQYVGSSADVYGLSGTQVGFPGNLNPSTSNPYPSETQTHAQPVYYERTVGYSGYDPSSQYHPVYYPQ